MPKLDNSFYVGGVRNIRLSPLERDISCDQNKATYGLMTLMSLIIFT